MTFVHADESKASEPGPGGDQVVVLAPKRAAAGAEPEARSSFLDHALHRTAAATGRRQAGSPSPPPAGRRRASPSYDTFKPRGSPTYDPLPAASAGGGGTGAASKAEPSADASRQHTSRSRSRSRSRKRRRSRSRSRSSSRRRRKPLGSSPSRHGKHKRTKNRYSSRSRSRSSGRSRTRSRDRRKKHGHRSRSRSRGRGRSRDRYYAQHGRPAYSSYSRSRSRSRGGGRGRSRDRDRGSPPRRAERFSSRERADAWREQRQAQQQVRRGKQGLGFAPADPHQGSNNGSHASQGGSRAAGTTSSSKGVAVISAASIPGYSSMTPAEQLKARMKLLMTRADQQNAAAAAAAEDEDVGIAAAGAGTAAGGGWTRFVLDRHAALDEDKQAMQQLLDQQVGQAGFGGSAKGSADADGGAAAAFIMGTGRAAARKAAARHASDQAHEDAIFGGGGASGCTAIGRGFPGEGPVVQQSVRGEVRVQQLEGQQEQVEAQGGEAAAASLGLAEGLVQQQKGLSWRERALAKRQQQQP